VDVRLGVGFALALGVGVHVRLGVGVALCVLAGILPDVGWTGWAVLLSPEPCPPPRP
jgi:hypothetical protein